METLRRHDFEGPAWEVFIGVMQEESCGVVEAWIKSGRMLSEAKKKGRPAALPPALHEVLRHDGAARHDLAQDALVAGGRALRTVLRDGRWDPRRSDLKTTFINLVVCQFSTAAKTWAASEEYRTREEATDPNPEQQDFGAADQFTAAEDWIDLDARFREERETVRAMIRLRAMGMAPKDIAAELDLSHRSAEGIWRRFTTKLRDQGPDGRPA